MHFFLYYSTRNFGIRLDVLKVTNWFLCITIIISCFSSWYLFCTVWKRRKSNYSVLPDDILYRWFDKVLLVQNLNFKLFIIVANNDILYSKKWQVVIAFDHLSFNDFWKKWHMKIRLKIILKFRVDKKINMSIARRKLI